MSEHYGSACGTCPNCGDIFRAEERAAIVATVKLALEMERQRADAMEAAAKDMAQVRDWAALRAEAAEAQLIAERQRAERLEAALREIADGSRWELAPDIAKSALGSICTTERHPDCYDEGCPWCIAHDSIHMAEPKGEP